MFLVEGVVKSAESLEEKCLLLLIDVCEGLNVLGGLGGTLGNGFGLAEELATVLGLFNNESLSESFLGG